MKALRLPSVAPAVPVVAVLFVMLFVSDRAAQFSLYCLVGFGSGAWVVYARTRKWAWALPAGVVGAVLVALIHRAAYAIGS